MIKFELKVNGKQKIQFISFDNFYFYGLLTDKNECYKCQLRINERTIKCSDKECNKYIHLSCSQKQNTLINILKKLGCEIGIFCEDHISEKSKFMIKQIEIQIKTMEENQGLIKSRKFLIPLPPPSTNKSKEINQVYKLRNEQNINVETLPWNSKNMIDLQNNQIINIDDESNYKAQRMEDEDERKGSQELVNDLKKKNGMKFLDKVIIKDGKLSTKKRLLSEKIKLASHTTQRLQNQKYKIGNNLTKIQQHKEIINNEPSKRKLLNDLQPLKQEKIKDIYAKIVRNQY